LRWLVIDSFRHDLRSPAEPFGITHDAHTVAAVNPFSRFANHASVAFKRNGIRSLFRHPLQALQFVRNLAAPKKRLEYEGIASSHDLGDLRLYEAMKFGLVDTAARSNHFCG